MTKTALILTIGLATEPSIKRINSLEPDLVYFIHSKKSKENALFIIEETGIENYSFKELSDHESVDDAFVKSLECIHELKEKGYEVIGDFTVGTKPMVAGLVMACIEEKCEPEQTAVEGLLSYLLWHGLALLGRRGRRALFHAFFPFPQQYLGGYGKRLHQWLLFPL